MLELCFVQATLSEWLVNGSCSLACSHFLGDAADGCEILRQLVDGKHPFVIPLFTVFHSYRIVTNWCRISSIHSMCSVFGEIQWRPIIPGLESICFAPASKTLRLAMMTINRIALYWKGYLPMLQIILECLILDFIAQREFMKSCDVHDEGSTPFLGSLLGKKCCLTSLPCMRVSRHVEIPLQNLRELLIPMHTILNIPWMVP